MMKALSGARATTHRCAGLVGLLGTLVACDGAAPTPPVTAASCVCLAVGGTERGVAAALSLGSLQLIDRVAFGALLYPHRVVVSEGRYVVLGRHSLDVIDAESLTLTVHVDLSWMWALDVAAVGDKAYVVGDQPELLRLDLAAPTADAVRIPLPTVSGEETDHNPDPVGVVAVGKRLYVLLQHRDDGTGGPALANGQVAVVDPETDTVEHVIDLPRKVSWAPSLVSDGRESLFLVAYDFNFDTSDSCIVEVTLGATPSARCLVPLSALEGDNVWDLAPADDGSLFAVRYRHDPLQFVTMRVWPDGTVESEAYDRKEHETTQISVCADRLVTNGSGGLRVFDIDTRSELTADPLYFSRATTTLACHAR